MISKDSYTVGLHSSDKGLRGRLIVAALAIAMVVSSISIIVAYRISADLGYSLELKSLEDQAHILAQQLSQASDSSAYQAIIDSLSGAHHPQPEFAPSVLLVSIGGEDYLGDGFSQGLLAAIKSSPEFSSNSSGLAEFDNRQVLWVDRTLDNENIKVIVLCNPAFLDKAMNYVTTRLSVTAFLTFWIAVWGAMFVSAFITRRVEKSREILTFLATHDSLTKLPNRTYLLDTVGQYAEAIKQGKKTSEATPTAALMILDLDRFKDVNDILGHAVGDDLLIALSAKIREALDDSFVLARIGGDEFVVWCEDIDSNTAMEIAEKITLCCRKPTEVNQLLLEMGISIGIACFPTHGAECDSLMRNADIAMYQAKTNRQGVKLYNEDDNTHSLYKIKLSSDLGRAIEQEEFVLYYQTKVVLATNTVIGVEALARWLHPDHGLIQPNDFINLIEQSGLVNKFSHMVLQMAIVQIRQWMNEGLTLKIAVNISPYNLIEPNFVNSIKTLLDENQVPAKMLEIELTESASMLSIHTTAKIFRQLKKIGVILSIDDYGTGMSSLAYLKELDVDYIKIDRSFISNLEGNIKDRIIVRSTIDMINQLGKKVVAEGIETQSIAKQLVMMGCEFGQGYLYSKPMPTEDISQLIGSPIAIKAHQ